MKDDYATTCHILHNFMLGANRLEGETASDLFLHISVKVGRMYLLNVRALFFVLSGASFSSGHLSRPATSASCAASFSEISST